jgi:hypothetical protein
MTIVNELTRNPKNATVILLEPTHPIYGSGNGFHKESTASKRRKMQARGDCLAMFKASVFSFLHTILPYTSIVENLAQWASRGPV